MSRVSLLSRGCKYNYYQGDANTISANTGNNNLVYRIGPNKLVNKLEMASLGDIKIFNNSNSSLLLNGSSVNLSGGGYVSYLNISNGLINLFSYGRMNLSSSAGGLTVSAGTSGELTLHGSSGISISTNGSSEIVMSSNNIRVNTNGGLFYFPNQSWAGQGVFVTRPSQGNYYLYGITLSGSAFHIQGFVYSGSAKSSTACTPTAINAWLQSTYGWVSGPGYYQGQPIIRSEMCSTSKTINIYLANSVTQFRTLNITSVATILSVDLNVVSVYCQNR